MNAIIVPGLTHPTTAKEYRRLQSAFEAHGYSVIMHNPDWEAAEVHKWVTSLIKVIREYKPTAILGFSMGGMIALLASTVESFENVIVCSPSGYFPEYQNLFQPDDFDVIKKYIKDFDTLSVNQLFERIKVGKGHILAGELEQKQWPDFAKWIVDLHGHTGWPLQIVPNTGHSLGDAPYQAIAISTIKSL